VAAVPVGIFVDIADADGAPMWLRIGVGVLRPDGSILARLDALPTNGRVRYQEQTMPGCAPPLLQGPPVAPQAPRAPVGVRIPPPPPACRRGFPGRPGGTLMKVKNVSMLCLGIVTVLAVAASASAAPREEVGPVASGPIAELAQTTSPESATAPTGVVNVNTATLEQLVLLPGVGPARAQAIIAFREQHPFRRVDELLQIRGIGRVTLDRMRPYVTVDGPTTLTRSVPGQSRRSR